jgi:hypothetical protein
LVVPIDGLDGETVDDESAIDFEQEVASITIADERAA